MFGIRLVEMWVWFVLRFDWEVDISVIKLSYVVLFDVSMFVSVFEKRLR